MTTHATPRTHPLTFSPAKAVLWVLALQAAILAGYRFVYGIGAVSNMNDLYPWGIWIALDLLCGVALAAGAFTMCAAVYIFRIEALRPLVKPAVLTGFLGYLMVIVALLIDLGRPERIYYMLIYRNYHSPLFEVGICVMTYTTVLFLEFSPTFMERFGWKRLVDFMHRITLPLVIMGVLLSTLHQSSLGSLFLMMSDKLHPLWHSPMLPVFFFLSAAAVGLGMVIVEASIASSAYGHQPEAGPLARLAKALPWLLGFYLALRLGELLWTGEFHLLFGGGRMAALFWAEIGLGVVAPLLWLALPFVRRSPKRILVGGVLVVLGLVLNRFAVGLVAWTRPAPGSYFPHYFEIAVSLGIIAAGVLAYDWVARNFRLFDADSGSHGH